MCDPQHCMTHLLPQHWKVEAGRKFQAIHLRLPETRDRGEREENTHEPCVVTRASALRLKALAGPGFAHWGAGTLTIGKHVPHPRVTVILRDLWRRKPVW